MKHRLLLATGLLVLFNGHLAQGQSAAGLQFVQRDVLFGGARYIGMGGALSAVGHDAGAVSDNPALGTVYRVGQLEGSLAQTVANGKARFGVPNLAYTHIFQTGSTRWALGGSVMQNNVTTGTWSRKADDGKSWVGRWLDQAEGNNAGELMGLGLTDVYQAYYTYILDQDPATLAWIPGAQGVPSFGEQTVRWTEKGFQQMVHGSVRSEHFSAGVSVEAAQRTRSLRSEVQEGGFSSTGWIGSWSWDSEETTRWTGWRTRMGAWWNPEGGPWRFGLAWRGIGFGSLRDSATSLMDAQSISSSVVVTPIKVVDKTEEAWNAPGQVTLSAAHVFGRDGLVSLEGRVNTLGQWEARTGGEFRRGAWSYRAGYRYVPNTTGFFDWDGMQQGSLGVGV
ncbi:MAG: hypothetical protein RLZZ114_989, partial [Bacteroidota bacterium]